MIALCSLEAERHHCTVRHACWVITIRRISNEFKFSDKSALECVQRQTDTRHPQLCWLTLLCAGTSAAPFAVCSEEFSALQLVTCHFK